MTETEFDQLIAEMTAKHGRDVMEAMLKKAADHFGWPIPASKRETVIWSFAKAFGMVQKPTTDA
jgi:hypothetical protein